MNTVAISPLITGDNDDIKYHCIMGGGLPARDTARVKVNYIKYITFHVKISLKIILTKKDGGYQIHLCNMMYGEELGTISGHFGPVNQLVF